MTTEKAIEHLEHIKSSYEMANNGPLNKLNAYVKHSYGDMVEALKIAITSLKKCDSQLQQASQQSVLNKVMEIAIDNRIYQFDLKGAQENEAHDVVKTINAFKIIADKHKISYVEMKNIIAEFSALVQEVEG